MRRHESVPLSPLPLPPEALDTDHRFATTLASGLELLRCFTVSGPALGNRELADLLRLPKSTISRLTFTLTALGFLRKNQALGKYELGPAVLGIHACNMAVPRLAEELEKAPMKRKG